MVTALCSENTYIVPWLRAESFFTKTSKFSYHMFSNLLDSEIPYLSLLDNSNKQICVQVAHVDNPTAIGNCVRLLP